MEQRVQRLTEGGKVGLRLDQHLRRADRSCVISTSPAFTWSPGLTLTVPTWPLCDFQKTDTDCSGTVDPEPVEEGTEVMVLTGAV